MGAVGSGPATAAMETVCDWHLASEHVLHGEHIVMMHWGKSSVTQTVVQPQGVSERFGQKYSLNMCSVLKSSQKQKTLL